MRKLKIYLDTSVISHLDHQDAPDKMRTTLSLWDAIKAGKYDVFISSITKRELEDCKEPKRSILFGYLQQITYGIVPLNEQTLIIADKMVELDILTSKSIDDCQHIAAAIASGCDIIVSWNLKHFVNDKIIQGVRAITSITGFPKILIYTPSILIRR